LKKSIKKAEDLVVITKTYDLILWSCNHTSKFPRNHRFVLGERIERNLYTPLETLIRAKYTKNRQRLLEEANLTLEILRFQMRPAKDLQCKTVCGHAHRLDQSEIACGDLALPHGTAPGQSRLWRADRLGYPDPDDGLMTRR
jgi:hypothetical protein